MNQILQVSDKKQLKSISAKRMVIYLIIVLALLCLGIGGYYIYENIVNGNIKLPGGVELFKNESAITLTQTDRDKLIIKVEDEEGISKIMYSINNAESQIIDLEGEIALAETINIPVGENTINISVIDVNGRETTKQESFIVEAPKPVIDLSVVGNDIKITVTSEIELKEIIYKWNSDNEKRENMITYEDRLLFEKQLEIPIGQNTLTIVATDINGGTAEKVQEIKGVTRATTTTSVKDGYLHFTVNGKENIEAVQFEFNGQKYIMNKETFGETKTVHYKVKLIKGKNSLTVISKTQSGGVDTTTWEEVY